MKLILAMWFGVSMFLALVPSIDQVPIPFDQAVMERPTFATQNHTSAKRKALKTLIHCQWDGCWENVNPRPF